MEEYRQPPPSRMNEQQDGGMDEMMDEVDIPSEAEMVLLCLDYLRELRRSYDPQDLFEAEGLHADYLSVAIYSLNRAFVGPPTLHVVNSNDPFIERTREQISDFRKELPHPDIFDDVTHFPDIETMTREVLYSESPHEEEKNQEHNYGWYDYDDSHPSNLHRQYPLNGLASGPSLHGPLGLAEIAAAGLSALQGRSRARAESEMITSPLFEQFVHAVKSKGFFRDPDNETPRADPTDEAHRIARKKEVYEDRFSKVVAKFRTKLASKARSGDMQASVVSESFDLVQQRRMDRIRSVRQRRGEDDEGAHTMAYHHQQQQQQPRAASQPSAVSDLSKRLAPSGRGSKSSEPAPAVNPEDLEEAEKLKSNGNAYMQKKEYQEAANAYTKALKLSPSGPNSHVYFSNRAAALLSMKKFNEAILDSERSLALKPNYGKAHARLGLAHFLLGNYRLAMEAYTVALKYEPDNKSSKSYLEKAAKRLAASGDAVDNMSLAGQSFSVVSEWDKSQRGRKSSQDTRTHYDAKLDLKEAEKHKVRGNAHMANREYKMAYEAYSAALDLSPKGPHSHVYYSNRAAALCYLERYAEAANDSEQALKMKPSYGKAHARLGLSRFFMNDFKGAIRAYTSALQHDPENAASKSYLAKAKLKLEQQNNQKGGKVHSDVRRLLNDPDMHLMAKKALNNPNSELMEDPEMQSIARKAMSDPAMMEAVRAVPQVQSP